MVNISDNSTKNQDEWDKLNDMYQEVLIAESSGHHRLNQRRSVLRLVPRGGTGAEIGVFTGLFAPILHEVCKPIKMYLVDPWDKLHGTHFPNWHAYTNHVRVPTVGARKAAELRASHMNCETEVITAFSREWLKTQGKGSLDWVYLDANHKYEEVLLDLRGIDEVLAENGIILGDDSWVKSTGEVNGVYKALHTFCRERNYLLIHLDEHGQWAIKRTCDVITVKPSDTEAADESETLGHSDISEITESTSDLDSAENSGRPAVLELPGFMIRLRSIFRVFG